MAVPARNIGGLVSLHRFGFDDDVFENFIEGMTNVNMAIGIRWAVMEEVEGPTGSCLLNPVIQLLLSPPCKDFRLPLGEVGLHWEIRLGQIKGRFVIHVGEVSVGSVWLEGHSNGPLETGQTKTGPQ